MKKEILLIPLALLLAVSLGKGIPAPKGTIAQVIANETLEKVEVTVDGQHYYIVTMRNRIDPETLEVVPDSGPTTVFIDAQRNPVPEPETVRQIAVIHEAREWMNTLASQTEISNTINWMNTAGIRYRRLVGMIFVQDALTEGITALITKGTSLKAEVVEVTRDTAKAFVANPNRIGELVAFESFRLAKKEYQAAIEIITAGPVTDYNAASKFIDHFMTGNAYNYPAQNLLLEMVDLTDLTDRGFFGEFFKWGKDRGKDIGKNLLGSLKAIGDILELTKEIETFVGVLEPLPIIQNYKEQRKKKLQHRDELLGRTFAAE